MRHTKKAQQQKQKNQQKNTGLELRQITPKTINQRRAFTSYFAGKNLMMHGTAGTGKSLIGLYLALNDVLNHQIYDKIMIFRSVVPSRDIGFLPGSVKEKSKVYEAPYYSICTELFERGDAYDILKQQNKIEFVTTSYIRGITINNAVVVVDEVQNMTWQEISTILTRIGENVKVIVCGDTKQSDLLEKNGKNDLQKAILVCQRMGIFDFIQMGINDIQRSQFVKQFITECERLGY